jgi:CheY-like chemotaxis protein
MAHLSLGSAVRAQVHVLIADGDETTRLQRGAQLQSAGFRVTAARTGFEAIVKASCHVPDVILLDGALADIDAAETGQMIATCPVTSHIPVLRLLPGRKLPRRVLALARHAAL